MNKATILYIGYHEQDLTALAEKTTDKFYLLTATDEETAIDRFLQSPVDAVVFGKNMEEPAKVKLTKIFGAQQAGTVFLNDEDQINMVDDIINAIIAKQKENKPAFSFKDDALKNAGLNIEIQ